MRGFAAGVLRYNREHATKVELVGWDDATASPPTTASTSGSRRGSHAD
jgi:hypothetical protein